MSEMTHEEFIATLTERFGESPAAWAFVCPICGDVATGVDMKQALADHPRHRRDNTSVTASDILGQECIGRTLGALSKSTTIDEWNARRTAGEVRGCDWAAYGLIGGPLGVKMGDGRVIRSFNIAPAEIEAEVAAETTAKTVKPLVSDATIEAVRRQTEQYNLRGGNDGLYPVHHWAPAWMLDAGPVCSQDMSDGYHLKYPTFVFAAVLADEHKAQDVCEDCKATYKDRTAVGETA